MDKGWRQCGKWMADFAPALLLAGTAVAGQPPATSTFNEFRGAARDNALSRMPPIGRLDLRPPSGLVQSSDIAVKPLELAGGEVRLTSVDLSETDAPIRRLDAHLQEASLEERSSMGRDGLPMARPMSRVQEMAHRFQREGLPVARLFENHSALVSLGLNQHGKPGIWLIQKLP
jgi:hypothetical protein